MNNKPEVERVRRQTAPAQLAQIERRLERNVRYSGAGSEGELARRLTELDREWSIERFLDTNASVLALTGAVLGLTVNRRWLLLSAAVAGFLLQHAVTGWCPPVPILRRLGVRTRSEINREKFALKALRGDFKDIDFSETREPSAVKETLRALAT